MIYNESLYYWLNSSTNHKSYLGKSGSSDMIQNALNQSDYRIFKSIISLKQNDEDQIFCMLIQSHGNKKSVEKNCGGSSQKWMLPL